MSKKVIRVKGEKYRPVVTVLKVKKEISTVIHVSGQTYMLQSKDQYRR